MNLHEINDAKKTFRKSGDRKVRGSTYAERKLPARLLKLVHT